MRDIAELLREAGIDAAVAPGPRLACGPVYLLRATSTEQRDAWAARLAAVRGVVALAVDEPLDWLRDRELPGEDEVRAILEDADARLVELDRWTVEPPAERAPDRLGAVRAWAAASPGGAPLGTLVDAIARAEVRALPAPPPREAPPDAWDVGDPDGLDGAQATPGTTLAVVPTDDPAVVLAAIAFGHFDACPPAAVHVARVRRWARDHGATLVALGADRYVLRIGAPPSTDEQVLRVLDEQAALHADERPPSATLRRATTWSFWWD